MKPKTQIRQLIPDGATVVEISDDEIITKEGVATHTYNRLWYQYPGEKPRLVVLEGGKQEKTSEEERMSI